MKIFYWMLVTNLHCHGVENREFIFKADMDLGIKAKGKDIDVCAG